MSKAIGIQQELQELLMLGNSRPYVFRTRLERAIERASRFAELKNHRNMAKECYRIKEKLNFISDQSNQTADGTLRSFELLSNDIKDILHYFQAV